MRPTQYRPTEPHQFVGKARRIAALAFKRIRTAEPNEPIKLLFHGSPGTGKSSLATALASEMSGGQACNIHLLNGQSLSIEVVRQWREEGHYRSILGGRIVKLVEEVDAASLAAMNELRTWLDNIQNGTAFIATTNKKLPEVQEQLSSRCFPYDFTPGGLLERTIDETVTLLRSLGLGGEEAGSIAANCGGNVRAALIDAELLLDTREVA